MCTLRMSCALGGAQSREPRSSVLSPNSNSDTVPTDFDDWDAAETIAVADAGFVSDVGEVKLAGRGRA